MVMVPVSLAASRPRPSLTCSRQRIRICFPHCRDHGVAKLVADFLAGKLNDGTYLILPVVVSFSTAPSREIIGLLGGLAQCPFVRSAR
jgi:hypothetical protein